MFQQHVDGPAWKINLLQLLNLLLNRKQGVTLLNRKLNRKQGVTWAGFRPRLCAVIPLTFSVT